MLRAKDPTKRDDYPNRRVIRSTLRRGWYRAYGRARQEAQFQTEGYGGGPEPNRCALFLELLYAKSVGRLGLGRADHLPVLVEDGIDALHADRDDGEKAGDQLRERRRPDDVDEDAVAAAVIFVDRAVEQRVVEDE